jgi:hypothetical protein
MKDRRHPGKPRIWAVWVGLIVEKGEALEPSVNYQAVDFQRLHRRTHGPKDSIQVRVEV